MKERLAIYLTLFILIILVSCGSKKKIITLSKEDLKFLEVVSEEKKGSSYTYIDTSKVIEGEATYIEFEFYPPGAGPAIENNTNVHDNNKEPEKPPNIKSIKYYNSKNKNEEKAIKEEQKDSTSINSNFNNNNTYKEEEIKEEPAPDPNKYKYIYYIIILVVGIIIYFVLRKTKVFTSIKYFFKKFF